MRPSTIGRSPGRFSPSYREAGDIATERPVQPRSLWPQREYIEIRPAGSLFDTREDWPSQATFATLERMSTPHRPGSGPKLIGRVLEGRYELLSILGRGGMADVYRAYFRPGGSFRAVKIMRPGFVGDADVTRRFAREFKALHQIDHESVVRAFDYGLADDGRPYMAMEYLDGESLHDLLDQSRRIEPLRAVRIAVQLCVALGALHEQGIVHRDLKPGNVLLLADDRVKLIDLGIARLTDDYYARDGRYITPPSQRIRTPTPFVMGTPGYIAPELGHEHPEPRSDIFSLGVVLYRMLSGTIPFRPSDKSYSTPASLVNLPRSLERVVFTALEVKPIERYQSVDELREELEDALLDLESDSEIAELDDATPTPDVSRSAPRLWQRPAPVFSLGAIVGGLSIATVLLGLHLAFDPPESPRLASDELAPTFTESTPAVPASSNHLPAQSSPTTRDAERGSQEAPASAPDPVDEPSIDTEPVELKTPTVTASPPRRARARRPAIFDDEFRRILPSLTACTRFGPAEVTFAVRARAGAVTLTPTTPLAAGMQRCIDRAARQLDFGASSFRTKYTLKPSKP